MAVWLRINPLAHMVVISARRNTQNNDSRGIQEVYFNAIRRAAATSTWICARES